MTSTPEDRSHDFSAMCEVVRGRWQGLATAESPSTAPLAAQRIPERLVQAIWYEKLLQPANLKTVSGKPLAIHSPGRWNESAGPDFLGAEISIGDKRISGDIEVHVRSVDWTRHSHHRDFAYNGVVLHVYLCGGDQRTHDDLHNGQRCERFEIEPFLFPDLDTIRQTLAPEDYPYNTEAGLGRCHDYFMGEDIELVRGFLAIGGRERIEGKIRRLARQQDQSSLSQLFYQALMTAMGFKGNKTLFFLLAKRTPIDELLGYTRHLNPHETVECIQAILLHVAGLTPCSDEQDSLPPATLEYLNRINAHWAEVCGYFADRLIPPTRRWHGGVRPVNFPERRLAGIARFIVLHARGADLFEPFLEHFRLLLPDAVSPKNLKALLKQSEQLFVVEEPQDFWATHYSFAAKAAAQPMSLIGASRAHSIVFNALIPLLLLHAKSQNDPQLEKLLWDWAGRFPMLETNNIERFMRYRLFANTERASALLDSEIMQQGLFQVFQSCCNNNERDCTQCLFLKGRM